MLYRMNNYWLAALLLTVGALSLLSLGGVAAEPRNLTVTVFGPEIYADIWLGISTGGYDVVGEKGKDLVFRVFVKNGMTDRSLHNVELVPTDFPFEINSITPRIVEQLKPMEIVVYHVNCSVPEDVNSARYGYQIDVASDEFPIGVFRLEDNLKILDRIKVELYGFYIAICVVILLLLFYRKWTIAKQGRDHSKK